MLFDAGQVDPSDLKSRFHSARGFSNLRLMWEEVFVPLTRAMLPGVLDAAERFQPNVLISDQQTLAGALAARKLGLVWATTACTPVDRVVSLRWLPKVLAWTEERLADLQREIGLMPVDTPEDSPYLVLSFTTEALAGEDPRARRQYRYVGPALGRRDDDTSFPWERLLPLPRVLVSLGTLNVERGRAFFDQVKQALADLPIQVILVAPDDFGPFPTNVIAQPWVPQLELLARVDLLVSHGGNNSVCEALARAIPVIVVPVTNDQPAIAQQVVNSGCGLRLSFRRSSAAQIRDAVHSVLADPRYRLAAQRISRSFEEAGGARRAADLLETLAQQRFLQ